MALWEKCPPKILILTFTVFCRSEASSLWIKVDLFSRFLEKDSPYAKSQPFHCTNFLNIIYPLIEGWGFSFIPVPCNFFFLQATSRALQRVLH